MREKKRKKMGVVRKNNSCRNEMGIRHLLPVHEVRPG